MYAAVATADGKTCIVPASNIVNFDPSNYDRKQKYKVLSVETGRHYDGVVLLVNETEKEVERKLSERRVAIPKFNYCKSAQNLDEVFGKDKTTVEATDESVKLNDQIVKRKIAKVMKQNLKQPTTANTTLKNQPSEIQEKSEKTQTVKRKATEELQKQPPKKIVAKNKENLNVSMKPVARATIPTVSSIAVLTSPVAVVDVSVKPTSTPIKTLKRPSNETDVHYVIEMKQLKAENVALKKICGEREKQIQELKNDNADLQALNTDALRLCVDLNKKVIANWDDMCEIVRDIRQKNTDTFSRDGGFPHIGYENKNNQQTHIGHGMYIPSCQFSSLMINKKPKLFVKEMARAIFGIPTLLVSTVTGKLSNRNKNANTPQPQKLDPTKMSCIKECFQFFLDDGRFKNLGPVAKDTHIHCLGTYISEYISDLKKIAKKDESPAPSTACDKIDEGNLPIGEGQQPEDMLYDEQDKEKRVHDEINNSGEDKYEDDDQDKGKRVHDEVNNSGEETYEDDDQDKENENIDEANNYGKEDDKQDEHETENEDQDEINIDRDGNDRNEEHEEENTD